MSKKIVKNSYWSKTKTQSYIVIYFFFGLKSFFIVMWEFKKLLKTFLRKNMKVTDTDWCTDVCDVPSSVRAPPHFKPVRKWSEEKRREEKRRGEPVKEKHKPKNLLCERTKLVLTFAWKRTIMQDSIALSWTQIKKIKISGPFKGDLRRTAWKDVLQSELPVNQ